MATVANGDRVYNEIGVNRAKYDTFDRMLILWFNNSVEYFVLFKVTRSYGDESGQENSFESILLRPQTFACCTVYGQMIKQNKCPKW